jgi:hypothetical protein
MKFSFIYFNQNFDNQATNKHHRLEFYFLACYKPRKNVTHSNLKKGRYKNLNTKQKIIKAKLAGFCYGVKRAVDLSIQTKQLNPDKKVYILGQLIHNNQVIEHLNSLGILTIDNIRRFQIQFA